MTTMPPTSAPDLAYQTQTITNREQLTAIAPAWQTLGDKAGGPIEQLEWTEACVDAYMSVGDLHVVAVSQGEQLAAVAPMAVKSINGIRRAVMLGVDECNEPMDLLPIRPHSPSWLIHLLSSRCR